MKAKNILLPVGLGLLMTGITTPVHAVDPFGVYQNDKVPVCQRPDLSKELTLLDAMEIAVCESPTLKSSYLSTQVSAASYGQSLSNYLPTVSGTGSLDQNSTKVDGNGHSDLTDTSARVSLNWLLLDFGGRSGTADKFKSYLSSAYYGYDSTLQTTLYNVADKYYSVLSAEEKFEGLQKSEEASKKAFEEANSRYKLGLVPLSDKLQAETAYAQARLETTVAKKTIALERGNLANLLNLPPYTHFRLYRQDKTIEDKVKLGDIEKLITTALENRPDYKAKQKDKEGAAFNVQTAKSGHLPTLSAVGSAGAGKEVRFGEDGTYSSSIGLQLSIPIFSGFDQSYKVGQARYELKQLEEQVNQLKIDIENEVWAAVQDYKTSYQTHQISKTLLASAEESERVAFASYKVGKVNILTLLDAQSQLASARIEYSTSFYNFMIAKNNLMRALGQMEKKV